MFIRRSEVPRYLHDSAFYLSLSPDDNEELSIPDSNMKLNDSVTDEDSLRHLLSTLRFWGANNIPYEVFKCVRNPAHTFVNVVVIEFERELTYLRPLVQMQSHPRQKHFTVAAQSGSVELLKYLIRTGAPYDASTTAAAAGAGHLHCLQYLHSIRCAWGESCCIAAAKGGHFECLKFARSHGCSWPPLHIAQYAANSGDLACLKYTAENDCSLVSAMYNKFVNSDNVDCVVYLHSIQVPFPQDFAYHAVGENSLKCLDFALKRGGCNFRDTVLSRVRSVECMHVLHDAGYHWTVHSAALAAQAGIMVLQFLHEHGCPWDESTLTSALTSHKVTASNEPDITCLVYAMENGCPVPSDLMMYAIQEGNLPAVKYLLTCGWECDATDTETAASKGQYNILVYLHSQKVPWDERTTRCAVCNRHLKCLKYAIANHCPVDADIGRYPALFRSVDTVKFLHSIGFTEYPLCEKSRSTIWPFAIIDWEFNINVMDDLPPVPFLN